MIIYESENYRILEKERNDNLDCWVVYFDHFEPGKKVFKHMEKKFQEAYLIAYNFRLNQIVGFRMRIYLKQLHFVSHI